MTQRAPTAAVNGVTRPVRLPDFFIVGAPKCGTTTLYHYLLRHPGVFMSTPKEMSFFSKPEVYARGFDWYGALFADAATDQICGEASTTYARWPTYEGTVDRMADAAPNARLVYLVRNPVDRLYSFYAHRMRESVTAGIDEFLDGTPEAIHSGLYGSQVDELLRRYPREQLHVMLLDDLKADPQGELERLGAHLGLSPFDYLAAAPIVANQGSGHHAATTSITRALDRVKRTPVIGHAARLAPASVRQQAFKWLQSGPVGKRLKNRHTRKMTPMTPALRRRLHGYFAADLERFEELLGRDLQSWKPSGGDTERQEAGR